MLTFSPLISSSRLLQHLLELLCNCVTDLGRAVRSTNILCADTGVDGAADGLFDGTCLGGEVEGVEEHEGNGEDRADGVHDALSGDVRGGPWGC